MISGVSCHLTISSEYISLDPLHADVGGNDAVNLLIGLTVYNHSIRDSRSILITAWATLQLLAGGFESLLRLYSYNSFLCRC